MSLMKEKKNDIFSNYDLMNPDVSQAKSERSHCIVPSPSTFTVYFTPTLSPLPPATHTYVRVLPFWRENPIDQSEAGSRCSQPMAMYRLSRWEAGFSPPPPEQLILGHKHGSSECNLYLSCSNSLSLYVMLPSHRVHSHAPSIRSHRGIKVVWPDFQPMRVAEEPVCVHLFRQKPVYTSLHLKSPVHVHRLWIDSQEYFFFFLLIY